MDIEEPVEKPISAEPYGSVMVVWLAVQLGALGLAVGRVLLWAHEPRAGEQLALAILLVAQVCAAALLLPLLWGRRATAILILTGWPMAVLAGFVADMPFQQIAVAEFYVSVWLLTVHLWSRVISTPAGRLYASAIAALMSMGGPVLYYLSLDFWDEANQALSSSVPLSAYGPAMGAVSLLVPHSGFWLAWRELALMLLAGLMATGFELVIRRSRLKPR